MKKKIIFLLALLVCILLCACGSTIEKRVCSIDGCTEEAVEDASVDGDFCEKHLFKKKAFMSAKDAYVEITAAYSITEVFGSDIYEAWRAGISDKKEVSGNLDKLAKKMNISSNDLRLGIVYLANRDKWENMTDKEIKTAIKESADYLFEYLTIGSDSIFSDCVNITIGYYEASGKIETAKAHLDKAKEIMKQMSELYSDYEHYPALKGYFVTTSSYFDFCCNPVGSFEQIKTTLENYRTDARTYRADLDYIFE